MKKSELRQSNSDSFATRGDIINLSLQLQNDILSMKLELIERLDKKLENLDKKFDGIDKKIDTRVASAQRNILIALSIATAFIGLLTVGAKFIPVA